jgi:iron complex outermembrane receptor protein
MKKKWITNNHSSKRQLNKLLRFMKIATLFIIACTLNLHATVYSQNTKFSYDFRGKTVREVFTILEKNSKFRFFYNDNFNYIDQKVDIVVKDQNVEEILSKMLSSSEMTYRVLENNLVVLTPSESMQTITVKGKVTDGQGGGLPGVNIVVKGTTIGTTTDIDGDYSLDLNSSNVILVFSYIGYLGQEVALEGRSTLNLSLVEDVQNLEEVVVVGYGTQSKREISGSVTNLTSKQFNKGLTSNAADLLQGKVAGLVITKGTGDVTSDATVRLRGTSSLTGSSTPFVVIDGVPGGDLNSVAPQDIESISILKDASSAAIYGSRSASGVILITTKKGSVTNTRINYESYVAVDKVTNKPDMLNGAEWRKYAADNNKNIDGMDLGADTDWFGEILRTGVTHNHNLSLSGGSGNHNYMASVAYMDRQGVVKGNEMNRTNARFSFNQRGINDKLLVSFTGNAVMGENSPTETQNFILAYNTIPVVPVKLADGSWYDSKDFDQGNPVRNIELNKRQNKSNQFYGNFKADLELIKGLNLVASAYQERRTNDWGRYDNSTTERGRNAQGYAQRESRVWDRTLFEYTANYQKSVKDIHNIGLLAGYSWEKNSYELQGAQNRQFGTDLLGYDNLQAGENLLSGDVYSQRNMSKLISFFGRATYNFDEKYVFAATIRRDGSSKFGMNNKWGIFPSFSAAWNISRENFLSSTRAISDLKFRLGYGVTGNQDGLDPYRSLSLYGRSGEYYNDGKWFSAYGVTQNANPNLKWEKTAMFNIGMDFGFLNNRISGTFEWYNKKTSDLLYTYSVPVPPYQYNTLLANVGDMENKGVEVLLNVIPVQTKDLQWAINFNLAHNKNVVTKLSNEEFHTDRILSGSAFIRGGSNTTTHVLEEGQAFGTFYGRNCEGLDANGKYIFTDINEDGKIDDKDFTYIGSAQPKLTYGISNTVSYKKWDLSFFLRGVYGNKVLNYSRMSFATTQWLMGANVLREALTNGLKDSPIYSNYYIEDGSFLRLENLTLGYNFKTDNIKWMKNLRLYVVGQNLFLITKYKGLDPEVNMGGFEPGVEGRDYYPKSRTFMMGVNISF